MALAAFFACSRADGTENSASGTSVVEESSAEPQAKAFGSYEEAKEAIYELRDTRFENGAYDRAAVASFEDACSDAVMYLRHNREDEDYLQNCYALYEKTLAARDAVDYLRGDEMRVYINVNGTVREDRYSKCTVSFVDKEGGEIPSCKDTSALIRVRGNSTADQGEEKPYRIRFEQKQNMLGLHDGRKYRNWVLLRTYWHLAPDYMAFQLAKTIFGGKYYSSDCMFVNLYLNGADQGVYLLCEQNQAAKKRMDVYEPEDGESRTDIGYLLEMDHKPDDEHPSFSIGEKAAVEDTAGQERILPERYYNIKSDTFSDEQADYIEKWLTGAYTVLYEAANNKAMKLDDQLQAVPAEERLNVSNS
jgi:hypothetical protein